MHSLLHTTLMGTKGHRSSETFSIQLFSSPRLFCSPSNSPCSQSIVIMAPAQIALPAPLPPTPTPSLPQSVQQNIQSLDESSIRTVDALVRQRARSNPYATIVSYPSSGVEFVDYSMQQLDVFAYRVARHYQGFIPTRTNSKVAPTTVAILGPSNFNYLITMLALTKLGHTVLFLSTRISQVAIQSLIETTGATYMLADTRFLQLASDVQVSMPSLHIGSIAGSSIFDFPIEVHADTRMDYQLDPTIEEANNIYIIHSSGMYGSVSVVPSWPCVCACFVYANFCRLHWPTKTNISTTKKCDRQLCNQHEYEGIHYTSTVSQSRYLQLLPRHLLWKVNSYLQRRSPTDAIVPHNHPSKTLFRDLLWRTICFEATCRDS
jgi:hypothetical protein